MTDPCNPDHRAHALGANPVNGAAAVPDPQPRIRGKESREESSTRSPRAGAAGVDARRLSAALAAFDTANVDDPNTEAVGEARLPREFLYGRRMSRMLSGYAPDASEAVQLAVRCQHLRRWEIPRERYPRHREGYLAWRRDLASFHAAGAAAILQAVGYPETMVARVASLVRKEQLKSDPEAQLVEDVAALVFLEHYLQSFVADHPELEKSRLAEIVYRTLGKMSEEGRRAAHPILARLDPAITAAVRDRPAR
jgi:hypothetical protein